MDQKQRTQKVAELQKLFPNLKVVPSFLHVYGRTRATLSFTVGFDVTEVRREVVKESLEDLIKLLQRAVDDMPVTPCVLMPCCDCSIKDDCDEREKNGNTKENNL